MRKLTLIIVIGVAVSCSGCKSLGTYFKDRGNDFADIFTAKVGYGYGAHAGVSVVRIFGVYAGGSLTWQYGFAKRKFVKEEKSVFGIPVVNLPGAYHVFFKKKYRVEYYTCFGGPSTLFSTGCVKYRNMPDKNFRSTGYSLDDINFGKPDTSLYVYGLFLGTYGEEFIKSYVTIDVCMLLSIEFGVSPYEIGDFLAGWFLLDFAGDDTKSK